MQSSLNAVARPSVCLSAYMLLRAKNVSSVLEYFLVLDDKNTSKGLSTLVSETGHFVAGAGDFESGNKIAGFGNKCGQALKVTCLLTPATFA